MDVHIQQRKPLKEKPNPQELGFGRHFTDHMFQVDYHPEKGWHDPQIVPYGPITLEPSNVSLHYGQLIFEGQKAYITDDGRPALFRPDANMNRLNSSARRLCMPEIDVEQAIAWLKELIDVEKDWIPTLPGSSLYIRPFVIATSSYLGVRPSDTYRFYIILSPVGSYYKEGLAPTRIFVENQYVRAVRGGTGEIKCAGNYAASLASQSNANDTGYTQVLWLDGLEQKYIEEVGTSNVFFVIDGAVITPALNGTILPGITRDSTLTLLRHWGLPVEERQISIDEVVEAYDQGTLQEAFATGTAAVVSPIGQLTYKDKEMVIGNNEIGPIAQRVYDGITGIQTGKLEDPFGWIRYI